LKLKRQISMNVMKEIELELLREMVKICKKHNLRYFLTAGTLLGAIRHKGFIPWDDDIDIFMPRKDYIKLIKVFDLGKKENMKMLSVYTESDFYYAYLKVVDTRTKMFIEGRLPIKNFGVCIDIFPMDGLPENERETKILFKKMKQYREMQYTASLLRFIKPEKWYKVFPKHFKYLVAKSIGFKKYIQIIEKLATKYDFETCDYIGCSVAGYGIKEKISKKAFESAVEVQFEDGYYLAPIGYNEYLTNIYGDYMQIPPEGKRIPHHNYEAYWK